MTLGPFRVLTLDLSSWYVVLVQSVAASARIRYRDRHDRPCVVCCHAIGLKHRLGFDDSLDVVGVHLTGGAFGVLSLGVLAAYSLADGQRKRLFYGDDAGQLAVQAR